MIGTFPAAWPSVYVAEEMWRESPVQTYELPANEAEFYESTFVPALFGGWARRLVEFAGVKLGSSVLDVACGTGVVARTAAERVGPSGLVAAVDVNEAVLAVARRLRPELPWHLGDACALPFADGSFDLALSQAGLMFFRDRVAALREMGRVAGQVFVQVPGRLSHSPGYFALTDVVARHAGGEVFDLLEAYFAVGEPDLLTGLFQAAGLRIDRLESWVGGTYMDSVDTFLYAELLPIASQVDPAVLQRIAEDCRTALASFIQPDGSITAPIEAQLIAASPVRT
jgi:SAM-dependent methyltransferase